MHAGAKALECGSRLPYSYDHRRTLYTSVRRNGPEKIRKGGASSIGSPASTRFAANVIDAGAPNLQMLMSVLSGLRQAYNLALSTVLASMGYNA